MFIASPYWCDVYAASAVSYETFSGITGVVVAGVLVASTLGVGTGSPVETCWCFSWPPQAAIARTLAASVAVAAIVVRRVGRYMVVLRLGLCPHPKASPSPVCNLLSRSHLTR